MDKILSLLYLTLVSWWFLTFILKFTYQKHISYFLGILFFTSFLFHGISINLSWLGLQEHPFALSLYWAPLHLGVSCLYGFVISHLVQIPNNKKNNIVTKILLLNLFLGMTKPLIEYQSFILLINLIILVVLSWRYKNAFRLTFPYQMIGLCLLVTFIVLKMSGYDIIFLNLIAVYYLKESLDHFNFAALGDIKLVS